MRQICTTTDENGVRRAPPDVPTAPAMPADDTTGKIMKRKPSPCQQPLPQSIRLRLRQALRQAISQAFIQALSQTISQTISQAVRQVVRPSDSQWAGLPTSRSNGQPCRCAFGPSRRQPLHHLFHRPFRHALPASAVVLALLSPTCLPAAAGTEAPATGTGMLQTGASACPCDDMAGVQRAALAPFLTELAYSEGQRAVFVTALDGEPRDGDAKTAPRLLRLDPETLAVQAAIPLPHRGFGLALDEAAQRLYVGHGFDGSVSVVDIAGNRVLKTVPVVEKQRNAQGQEEPVHNLRQLVVDPQHHRLYLPGLGGRDSTLYVVDTRALALEKRIPGFGFQATGITLDSKGERLFVSNMQGQLISVNRRRLQRLKTLEVEADQLLNLVFDAGRQQVLGVDQGVNRNAWRNRHLDQPYVPRSEGHQVQVIDPDSGRISATLDTDKYPLTLLLDGTRQRLYVSNFNGIQVQDGRGTVQIFDNRTHRLLRTIPLPPHAGALALDARRNVLYVTIKNDARREQARLNEQVARIALE